MGDGVNIAARLEGVAAPGGISLSEDAYRQVRDRLKEEFVDLGDKVLKNIARPVRVYSLTTGSAASAPAPQAPTPEKSGPPRLSIVVLPFANLGSDPEQEYFVDGIGSSKLLVRETRIPQMPSAKIIAATPTPIHFPTANGVGVFAFSSIYIV
jgi:hypothetical protein